MEKSILSVIKTSINVGAYTPIPTFNPMQQYIPITSRQRGIIKSFKDTLSSSVRMFTNFAIVVVFNVREGRSVMNCYMVSAATVNNSLLIANVIMTQAYCDLYYNQVLGVNGIRELADETTDSNSVVFAVMDARFPMPKSDMFDLIDGRLVLRTVVQAQLFPSAPLGELRSEAPMATNLANTTVTPGSTLESNTLFGRYKSTLTTYNYFSNRSSLTYGERIARTQELFTEQDGDILVMLDRLRGIAEVVQDPDMNRAREFLDNNTVQLTTTRNLSTLNVEEMMTHYNVYLRIKFPTWSSGSIIGKLARLIIVQGYSERSPPITLSKMEGTTLVKMTKNLSDFLDRDIGFNQKLIIRYFSEAIYGRETLAENHSNWLNNFYNDMPEYAVILGMEYWCSDIQLLTIYLRSRLYHAKAKFNTNNGLIIVANQMRKISQILNARRINVDSLIENVKSIGLDEDRISTGPERGKNFSKQMIKLVTIGSKAEKDRKLDAEYIKKLVKEINKESKRTKKANTTTE